jgi:leucyl aminopeptidase
MIPDVSKPIFSTFATVAIKSTKKMEPKIVAAAVPQALHNVVFLVPSLRSIPKGAFSKPELDYIRERTASGKTEWVPFNRLGYWQFVQFIKEEKNVNLRNEWLRKAGDRLQAFLNEHGIGGITVAGPEDDPEAVLAFSEGMALGSYRFLKYKTKKEEANSLQTITIASGSGAKGSVLRLNSMTEGVFFARNLINEPNSTLSAKVFGRELEKMGRSCGLRVEVLNRNKLEALQMGGILGVNKGSHEPPVLVTLEYKPARPKNKKPIVVIGKGVMFDSGGMNLKPGDSMYNMKDDMSGGAAVAGVMLAAAMAKLPVHLIGLVPATDNRPGEKAIVPGDVLRMHNGSTVEVIDTDAEGRLILADALSYAARFKPELVIDLATLTGSASRALGKNAMAGMQSGAQERFGQLVRAGFAVHERIVELPLWEDYAEGLKSEVADMKNLAGPEAGAITAGKFLEKFTSYPYIHLDIAGPAFLEKRDGYRGTGGTGVGVRLLFCFFSNL